MAKPVQALLGGVLGLGLAQGAARAEGGPYVNLGIGVNFREQSDLMLRGATADQGRRFGLGPQGRLGFSGGGLVALGSAGWSFGAVRAEAEFSYRTNDVASVALAGFPGRAAFSGSSDTYAAMANLVWQPATLRFDLGVPVTPHLGFGLGHAWTAYREIIMRTRSAGIGTYGVDGRFAWQAIAGLSWDLASLRPGLSLTTEYRYFSVPDQQVKFGAQVGRHGFRDGTLGATNHNHALVIGLRYQFWSMPAPAAPR
ncbi:outer membrane protein [Paracraurococcus ruber]|uniref:Outer membrane protein beta-barrel domain-containing protein n=1 Tax=Paracraurococcus ruber TaxID=77675 RepID=A0ABS1CZH2_9PROT|nr:outer membrane beta-barrel protein [Paracraurococcus ruber]MBK1659673.1 hypothetical protein [Paracraurococcus ruber]TDG29040.1 hypothetical protein E2C05_18950 [Paracraurococcus ruber]